MREPRFYNTLQLIEVPPHAFQIYQHVRVNK